MSKNTVLEEVNNLSEKLSNSFNVRFDDSIKFNDIIKIQKSDDYIDTLKKELESYKKNFEKDAFYLFYSGFNLKEDVEKNCKSVQKISELLMDGVNDEKNKYYNEAKDKMKKLLKKYIGNKFILGEIDKNYAFRGSGSDKELCDTKELHEIMNRSKLIFYRSRVDKNKKTFNKFSEITSLSNSNKKYASSGRFSKKEVPCLYLSLSSYASFLEVGNKNNFEEIYTSAFKFNEIGLKKVKVLNLAISEELLNGIFIAGHDHNMKDTKLKNYLKELKISLLKIAPLLIASNFRITDKNDKFYEYLFSQCIIESLSELGDEENIYGVAYISKREDGKAVYPYCINLAIPINDLDEKEEFGKLYKYIDMTGPVLNKYSIDNYGKIEEKRKPFIEETFFDDSDEKPQSSNNKELYDFHSDKFINYKNTDYYKVDYYLANIEMTNAMEVLKSE